VSKAWKQIDRRRWGRVKALALIRDGYRCVKCPSAIEVQVDHIKPLATHFHLAYVLTNLQTLCRVHHEEKTTAQNNGRLEQPKTIIQDWWSKR
jgi:5-methylcytosine-specific restriction enzyme A